MIAGTIGQIDPPFVLTALEAAAAENRISKAIDKERLSDNFWEHCDIISQGEEGSEESLF